MLTVNCLSTLTLCVGLCVTLKRGPLRADSTLICALFAVCRRVRDAGPQIEPCAAPLAPISGPRTPHFPSFPWWSWTLVRWVGGINSTTCPKSTSNLLQRRQGRKLSRPVPAQTAADSHSAIVASSSCRLPAAQASQVVRPILVCAFCALSSESTQVQRKGRTGHRPFLLLRSTSPRDPRDSLGTLIFRVVPGYHPV